MTCRAHQTQKSLSLYTPQQSSSKPQQLLYTCRSEQVLNLVTFGSTCMQLCSYLLPILLACLDQWQKASLLCHQSDPTVTVYLFAPVCHLHVLSGADLS